MSKNIVLCFDGTSNRYSADNTNVVKLYSVLARQSPDQCAYYQPGIGTMTPVGMYQRLKKWFAKWIDLAFANLLDDHVKDGYIFLMRYYEPGDRIYLFGFSRGAYTARVLAGMIHKVGLLSRGNDELVSFAWDLYANSPTNTVSDGFRSTFGRVIPIHFLGLWDTVSSISWAFRPRVYAFTYTNPSVEVVRHAMALDERRQRFAQNSWTSKPSEGQNVKQVWFAGVHADVGGGYPETESGLSKITLNWMLNEARAFGLSVDAQQEAVVVPKANTSAYVAANPLADAHESLTGRWWIVEFIPLPYRDPTKDYAMSLQMHLGRKRHIFGDALVHESVIKRQRDRKGYIADNLPSNTTVVD
jgi:uncharacterized protein (DUF2235 family)